MESQNDVPPLASRLTQTLRHNSGLLFAVAPTIVCRSSYHGQDVIAPNSSPLQHADERGYLPTERWLMSSVQALNEVHKAGEGLTRLSLLGGHSCTLSDALEEAPDLLLGRRGVRWPLLKVLDIGSGIPAHVHSGHYDAQKGCVCGPGKLEAYFFPPLNVAPHNVVDGAAVKTWLGLRSGVERQCVVEAMQQYGLSDAVYALCNEFTIEAGQGWTIRPGVLHAPGARLTLEVQLPQDDFNMYATQRGRLIENEQQRVQEKQRLMLRGMRNEEQVSQETLNWQLSTCSDFEERFKRSEQVLEEGAWGRRTRIFFDEFYGESVVLSGDAYTLPARQTAMCGLVWSGTGCVNGHSVVAMGPEFFVVPDTPLTLQRIGPQVLIVYLVHAMTAAAAAAMVSTTTTTAADDDASA